MKDHWELTYDELRRAALRDRRVGRHGHRAADRADRRPGRGIVLGAGGHIGSMPHEQALECAAADGRGGLPALPRGRQPAELPVEGRPRARAARRARSTATPVAIRLRLRLRGQLFHGLGREDLGPVLDRSADRLHLQRRRRLGLRLGRRRDGAAAVLASMRSGSAASAAVRSASRASSSARVRASLSTGLQPHELLEHGLHVGVAAPCASRRCPRRRRRPLALALEQRHDHQHQRSGGQPDQAQRARRGKRARAPRPGSMPTTSASTAERAHGERIGLLARVALGPDPPVGARCCTIAVDDLRRVAVAAARAARARRSRSCRPRAAAPAACADRTTSPVSIVGAMLADITVATGGQARR